MSQNSSKLEENPSGVGSESGGQSADLVSGLSPAYETISGIVFSNETEGAVDFTECGYVRCCCGKCVICGNHKHTAVHGPLLNRPPGSKPWAHKFIQRVTATTTKPVLTISDRG